MVCMKCELCDRDKLTAKELAIHKQFFHNKKPQGQQAQIVTSGVCPDCGAALFMQEGCVHCASCGYSKCG